MARGVHNGKPSADGFDLVVENRKARHDFFIEETLEAGLALILVRVGCRMSRARWWRRGN